MKKYFSNHKINLLTAIVAAAVLLFSCKKDSDGSNFSKPGTPVFGKISLDSAASGTVISITGSGLGDMRSIVFSNNNVPATITPTLNTSTSIVFKVPDTAIRGAQEIILTNSGGKVLKVPFKVLPFATVNGAFPTDFETGSLITLTGNNLDVMTKVTIQGTTTEATIVSQSLTQAVIQMPSTAEDKVKLVLTTSAGDKASTIEFVNVENATQVFTEDFVDPAQSWSWGGDYAASADFAITGSKSLKAAYDPNGTFGGLQIGMWHDLDLPAGTKYFTFWAKGADVDKGVKLEIKGNGWSTDHIKEITIPANKWTYFKEDVTALIPGVHSISVILFQIHDEGKTIYFDNIMFTK